MMNGKTSHPVPGPLCNTFAPLVPVLDDLTDTRLAADTRAHLVECAWCRAQQTSYGRFDEALRREFAPEAMPYVTIHVMESSMTDIRDGAQSVAINEDAAADDGPQMTIMPLPAQPRQPRRSRRLITGTASLAAVLVISLLAGAVFMTHGRPLPPASRHATGTPSIVPGSQITLMAVGMSSATDGWAMGRQMVTIATGGSSGSSDDPAYVLHYTGGRWVPVQTPIRAWISAIKMLSPTDGWAVGTRAYHYDGVSWREVDLPAKTQYNAIDVVAPNDIWIVGDDTYAIPAATVGDSTILHYDGTSWTRVSAPHLPDYFRIVSISMVSSREGWAVGSATLNGDKGWYPPTGAILHYVDGTWRLAKTLPGIDFSTISMGSSGDGWAGGALEIYSKTGQLPQGQSPIVTDTPKLWHFTGGQWVEASIPPQPDVTSEEGQISSITMFSATDGWMLAGFVDQRQYLDYPVPLTPDVFRLQHGQWIQVTSPAVSQRRYANMGQVTFVSPDEFWGVGDSTWWTGIPDSGGGYQPTVTPLIVHYDRGAWKVIEY